MNILTSIILSLALLIIAFRTYRFISFEKANSQISKKRLERVDLLYRKLKNGQVITNDEIYGYAENLLTREITFKLLQNNNLANVFPIEFNTFEKAAESNLANWLEFPTELNICPDEIEHIKRVTIDIDRENNHYEVFRFRINGTHWAAKNGWMLGVVGPYFDESKPYDRPYCTFSRFVRQSETNSPEEEARWVYENIL